MERRIVTPSETIISEAEITLFLQRALQYNSKLREQLFRLKPVAAAFIPVTGIIGRLEVKNSSGLWELRKEIVRSPDLRVIDTTVETPTRAYYFQFRAVHPAALIAVESDPLCRTLQVEVATESDSLLRMKKNQIVKNLLEDMQKVLENYCSKRS